MADMIDTLTIYLEKTDPNDWHRIAQSWNWDNGNEPLFWMIQQPTCDKATALLIYWRGAAGYYVQYENRSKVNTWELETYDLIKAIEQKYVSGFYTRQEIAFNPSDDSGYNRTTVYDDISVKQPIPAEMLVLLQGRDITGRYTEGFPPEI